MFIQETFGVAKQGEGMGFELSVVAELILGGSPESCEPDLSHRIARTTFITEENRGRSGYPAFRDQFQPSQNHLGLFAQGASQPSCFHCLFNGATDFLSIEIPDPPLGGNPTIPRNVGFQALHDAPIEFRTRHALRGVPDAQVPPAFECKRPRFAGLAFDSEHSEARPDPAPLGHKFRSRLNPSRGIGYISNRLLCDALPQELPVIGDTE
jgi:hypothetical protein